MDLKDDQFTHDTFHIRGPTSPLEVKFRGLLKMNATQNCSVSVSSINCVAIETDVSARHSRLMVAGVMSLTNVSRNRVSLSDTTIMPNLLDIPAFMCILWAPFVELRVNRLLSERAIGLPEEICGALCGLGFDPLTNTSYDANTDIEVLFDSSVTSEDIDLINLLRYQISQLFYNKGQHITRQTNSGMRLQENSSLELLSRSQQTCRQTLLKLLNRTRIARHWFVALPEMTNISPTYRWNMLKDYKWKHAYRTFECRPFSEALLQNLNLKTAVLTPISIPILNLDRETNLANCWENEVFQNLNDLEQDSNFQ